VLAVTVGVVVYGNVATVVLGESGDRARLAANLVFASIAVGVALRLGVGVRALGVSWPTSWRARGAAIFIRAILTEAVPHQVAACAHRAPTLAGSLTI